MYLSPVSINSLVMSRLAYFWSPATHTKVKFMHDAVSVNLIVTNTSVSQRF